MYCGRTDGISAAMQCTSDCVTVSRDVTVL